MITPSSKSDSKTKKKKRCENCGQELQEDEVYELDGMILCFDCYNEEEDLRAIKEEWIE
jgi:formylmethanofuran dehydrogenase subunit E